MLSAPSRLRCEYLSNPIGIDATRPRLSWWVDDPRAAEIQTGYHLLAATDAAQLQAGDGNLWDTGKVESQQTLNIEYRGRPLGSGQRVWWKVRSFDSDGLPSPWSEPGFFEVGLLEADAWRARWIGAPLAGSPATPVAVPALRRSFELPDDVVSARLNITALGVYRVEVNGQTVSQDQLAPGWTDYGLRVRCQTYDVTAHLRSGANAIGVLLGDGWYCGNPGIGHRQQYGERPLLCAQINVTLASGALLLICTDHQWKWRRSWLLYSDLVLGESVDGRQYQSGWSDCDCDETGWYPVSVEPAPGVRITPAAAEPVRSCELQAVTEPVCRQDPLEPPRWIYDFGRHIVGRARIRLVADSGVQLRFRYANRLDSAGELEAVDGGTDWYTTAGSDGGESYEAHFSLHGFRYIELCGQLPAGSLPAVTAIAVGTQLATTAWFNSDHPALNALFDAVQNNYRARALDIPLAGLVSEQRVGATGAVCGVASGMAFNLDVGALYAKWLDDLADAQRADGGFPPVVPVPAGVAELHTDAGLDSAVFVLGTWLEYRQFGNRRTMERHYAALCRYLRGLAMRWPEHVCEPACNPLASRSAAMSSDLQATASFFQVARIAARIAGVLGRLSDLEEFEELAQSVRSAFRRRFVTRDGRLVGDSDAAYALVLQLGLLDRAEQRAAFDTLVRRIERGGAGAVEPLAVPGLLQVLTRGGRLDLAYDLLLQPGVDGWLQHSLRDPAGLWIDPGAELARSAVGSVVEWLFTGLAGLDLDSDLSESNNAFRRVRIQPRPPLGLAISGAAPLRLVEVALDTVNGRYECGWEITESAFELRVLVPCNCSAVVVMPDDTEYFLAAGRHELQMPLLDVSDGIPILREVSQA